MKKTEVVTDVKEQIWLLNIKIINCNGNSIGIYQTKECLRDCRCEGTSMVYKCNTFVAVTYHFMGLSIWIDTHVCTISRVTGINKEKGNIYKWS